MTQTRLVGLAKAAELAEFTPRLRPGLRPLEQMLWFAEANELRLIGTDQRLLVFEASAMRKKGVLRETIELADIVDVSTDHEPFDDLIFVAGDNREKPLKLFFGSQRDSRDWIAQELRVKADVSLSTLRVDPEPRSSIVFLHGQNHSPTPKAWAASLSRSLLVAGHDRIDRGRDRLATPTYLAELDGKPGPVGGGLEAPPDTLGAASLRDLKDQFQQRSDELRSTLLPFARTPFNGFKEGRFVHHELRTVGVLPFGPHAQTWRYANEPRVRTAVRSKVLSRWPRDARVVLIGHSLGSVIALDMLSVLPATCRISLLTLGSPLPLDDFDRLTDAVRADFPYQKLEAWVNLYDRRDEVTGGEYLPGIFPHVVNVDVNLEGTHDAVHYLSHPATGETVRAFLPYP